ncbi:hypothetical protein Misp03_74200 [Microbispora sp. NBRC 16548]|nr:hypothetical protein Misp03_74200 [Microbispora sp. NBRC 16548]
MAGPRGGIPAGTDRKGKAEMDASHTGHEPAREDDEERSGHHRPSTRASRSSRLRRRLRWALKLAAVATVVIKLCIAIREGWSEL